MACHLPGHHLFVDGQSNRVRQSAGDRSWGILCTVRGHCLCISPQWQLLVRVGALVGGDVDVWSLSWASDVVSMEADVAMGALALSKETTD